MPGRPFAVVDFVERGVEPVERYGHFCDGGRELRFAQRVGELVDVGQDMADLALFAFERLRERIEVGDDIAQRTLFANHQIIDVACISDANCCIIKGNWLLDRPNRMGK